MKMKYWKFQDEWNDISEDLVITGRKAILELAGRRSVANFELVNPKTGELLLHIVNGQIVWLDSSFAGLLVM